MPDLYKCSLYVYIEIVVPVTTDAMSCNLALVSNLDSDWWVIVLPANPKPC